jgi:hypothetical protein
MNDFIEKITVIGNIEKSKNPASKKLVQQIEKDLKINLGTQMQSYLIEYGYIAFSFVEFYGANENQKLDSDIVVKCKHLYGNYTQTEGFIPLEDRGDGCFILCNSEDEVFEFTPSISYIVTPLNLSLSEYIVNRWKEIN